MTITLRPPGWHHRLWYSYLGIPAPAMVSTPGPAGSDWARLVPYDDRAFHEAYARSHGFFWLPCDLCGRPYGGHESAGSVPDPTMPPPGPNGPWYYVGICSACTRDGKSRS